MSKTQFLIAEGLTAAVLSGLTLSVVWYFAPRGFNAGFADMAHDGYQLRQALDLASGHKLFRDTFDQYGPLTPFFNQIGFVTSGRSLLGIKEFVAVWYAATSIAMYVLARQFLAPVLSTFSVLLWLALAPFYQHGIMLSPHAYVLLFQAAAIILIVNDNRGTARWRWRVAGALSGVCWLFKQSLGSLFFVALAMYAISASWDQRRTLRPAVTRLADLTASFAAVIGAALLWLLASGSLNDWYLQTIVFPSSFYLSRYPATAGEAPWFSLARLFITLQAGAAGYWMVLRVIVIVGGLVALLRRGPERNKLILAAWVTSLLWLSAFPSANYMHQWWTISLSLCAAASVVHATVMALVRPARPLGHALATFMTVLTIGILSWPGIATRWTDGWSRARTPSEVIVEPSTLRGMRTIPVVHRSIASIYETMVKFRANHPGTPVLSIDTHEGVTDNAESLLLLSFFEDNPHPGPVYWNLPVLSSSVYPSHQSDFERFVQDRHPLIVDYQNDSDHAKVVPGYYLLAAEPTVEGTWFVYAPQHTESVAHGEPAVEPPAVAVRRLNGAPAPTTPVVVDGVSVQARLYTSPSAATVTASALTTLPNGFEQPAYATTEVLSTVLPITVRGFAVAPDSYLLQLKERALQGGDYFIASGVLEDGGLTIGLQSAGLWAGFVNITTPGPFVAVIAAPKDGHYTLTIANCLTAPGLSTRVSRYGLVTAVRGWLRNTLPNSFRIEKAGWVNASEP